MPLLLIPSILRIPSGVVRPDRDGTGERTLTCHCDTRKREAVAKARQSPLTNFLCSQLLCWGFRGSPSVTPRSNSSKLSSHKNFSSGRRGATRCVTFSFRPRFPQTVSACGVHASSLHACGIFQSLIKTDGSKCNAIDPYFWSPRSSSSGRR